MTLTTGVLALAAIAATELQKIDFSSFRAAEHPTAEDLKAFENADFEDRSKFGTYSEGKVEIGEHLGFNGNAGVKITPKAKAFSYVLPTKARLEKGNRYVFSVDMLKHGEMDGGTQIACDVYFRKDGKSAGGFWGSKGTSLGAGWRRSELQVVPRWDPEEVDYKFMVYTVVSRKDGTDIESSENYVLVDNVSIRADVPQWHFSNVWPTHFKVFNDDGNLRSHSAFVGPYLASDADAVYEQKLVKPDGAVIARDVVRADAGGAMTARFGKFGYEGPVELVTTLYDLRNRLSCGTQRIALTATPTYRPKPGEIFVPENGVPLVDGKPFMPVGFYVGLSHPECYTREEAEEAMQMISEAGFNLIMDYNTYLLKGERMDWYYDAVRRHGLRVLNDDFKCNRSSEYTPAMFERVRRRAESLKKYPAIIGFYTLDEGNEDMIPGLTKLRRLLDENFPGAVVNTCNIFSPATYLPCADIAGGDKYPIDNKPGSRLGEMDDYCRLVRDTTAVGWHAPQCYNWANARRGAMKDAKTYRAAGREPKENEMLSVALMYASYGVKGFIFYSFFDIGRTAVREWPLLRWKRICGVGRDLRSLEPFIMSGRPIVELPHEDRKGKTRLVAFSDGTGAHRVVVLGLEKGHETAFMLPADWGELRSRCGKVTRENGQYVFRGADFSCDILQ